MKESCTFDDLLAIMDFLRSDQGCPWDRIQTHESIQGNMLEEAYEAVDAIQSGDPDKLREELGDVLMQVVFHAGIARDEGYFTFEDVVSGLCRKLISRHTHLFGDDQATTPDMVLRTWEKNKRIEKGFESTAASMRAIPLAMPALTRADKLQKKAADTGFDWPSPRGACVKVKEELQELLDEADRGDPVRIRQEAGDLLFAVVNLLRLLGVDPETALTDCSQRFIRRFDAMENLAKEEGVSLNRMDLEAMDALWDRVKRSESETERDRGCEA
ncbi:MAG: nucleoside triphosphate pyrophosphohydrolase [Fastidiosipila sp.]|nr:nucleoside triphosphate pyrophosphohydrolase [Fastidiosipila sp.]